MEKRICNVQEYDKRYKSIFHNAPHGMAIVGVNGSWLEVNDKICKITGYSREELLNLNFQSITHKEDLQKDLDNVKLLINRKINNYCIEKRYIKKDGLTVWIRLSVSAVFDDNNKVKYFISQIEDITNSKIMEYRQKLIFDEGHIGLAICDSQGRWIEVNKRFANKLGYTTKELLKTNFQSITHQKDLLNDLTILQDFLNNKYESKKWRKRYIKKNGSYLWCLINANMVPDIETGEPLFICSIQDIEEFVKLEDENATTNSQLVKTIEELTHFNYFAAHDLKESIRTIYNYCLMIKEGDCKEEEKPLFFNRIADKSEHLNDLVDDLLSYSKMSSTKHISERFSAYHSIITVLEDYSQEIAKKKINIIYSFDEDLHIYCSKSIFHHLMTNLLSNSIKYSSQNIKICIQVGKFKTLVKIIDDGEGIPSEYKDLVFKPFFRASTKLNGTGLGLSLCKKMIEKLGGKINLRSENDKGSTFWFSY